MAIGDDVYDAVGNHWWLLTLDRDRVDTLLGESSVGADTVSTYSDRVTTLRDSYSVEETEVESTRAGRRHTYHLTDRRVGSLDRDQKIEISEVADAVFDGLDVEAEAAEKDRDVSTDWYAKMHRKQAEYTLDEFDVTDSYANTLRKNTDDPDIFGCKECSVDWLPVPLPNSVNNAIESAVEGLGDGNEAKHPPFHFYLGEPPTFDLVVKKFSPPKFGGAPGEASYMVQQAQNAYSDSEKARYLGYAAHYLQDMSVPFHSGAVLAQLNYSPSFFDPLNFNPRRDIHYAYEQEINNNIESASYYVGDPFKTDFEDGYPYYVSGVADACKELSDFAGEYGPGIFDAVLNGGKNSPWDWDDGSRSVFEQTHNCMSEAGGYLRGFLYEHEEYNW
ncbi:MAG: Zinc dependent phospholipase C [halophilic archaeon J07HB67]|jgi:Zinc dependent phospholipase C.|nr:MAG: Zinc dependent phospholipase C [halophilic archaeon J07HB67]